MPRRRRATSGTLRAPRSRAHGRPIPSRYKEWGNSWRLDVAGLVIARRARRPGNDNTTELGPLAARVAPVPSRLCARRVPKHTRVHEAFHSHHSCSERFVQRVRFVDEDAAVEARRGAEIHNRVAALLHDDDDLDGVRRKVGRTEVLYKLRELFTTEKSSRASQREQHNGARAEERGERNRRLVAARSIRLHHQRAQSNGERAEARERHRAKRLRCLTVLLTHWQKKKVLISSGLRRVEPAPG